MSLDVEVLVLDPDRVVEAERHPAQLAGELRDVADVLVDAGLQRLERVAARHRRGVEHDHAAHVHELRGGLQVQEARVEP